ncbi:hypothetical protein PFICI_03432 [Pestalotiopsis fici W106-1]|uniref:Major facilitator superfamily (MFS) profile domain-containing protein n=1 Tax=Pestalotiopsis fici (strain W106-1 / CGMCC3.15140) TaxID=1229662 RepID=W3XIZ1_PESFW|nr:uncharacterized protein PFICI_03432 [Pestalotiopsis fici W106-1]ETS85407.1 hypothetical protein PFICI_03432 [Pestalotiopsis fici W106-1]
MRPETNEKYIQAPSGLREWIFVFVLCATQLFTQGALGYVLIPLSIVSETFHQTGHEQAAQMNWHVAGYSLTIGSFILVAGRLGDMYGSKNIFVLGWIWFAVWTAVGGCSALTGSAIFFDVCRALQGVGPALLLPNALAIAGRTYPPGTKKNIVFSLIAMCAPLGCSLGGLMGSALAQYALVALVHNQKLRFDWVGSVSGVGGLMLLNISWNQAPIDDWSTPYVYILLILGFLFLGVFVWYEKRVSQPIVDISIFNRQVAGVLLTTGLGWSSFGIWFYYMFQFLQQIRGVSSLDSAIQFIPGVLSGMIAPIFTAWALPRVPTSGLMVLSSFAFFAGSLLLTLAPPEQSYWYNTFWSFVIMPWGMDVSFPASTVFISDSVSVEHQGISASLVNTVINYSIALGLGIGGTVEVELPKGTTILEGYRAAQYTSVGLAALGLVISILLAVFNNQTNAEDEPSQEKVRGSDTTLGPEGV